MALQTAVAAELMQKEGFNSYSFEGGVKGLMKYHKSKNNIKASWDISRGFFFNLFKLINANKSILSFCISSFSSVCFLSCNSPF